MGAAAPRTRITCKALECKCTAEHSLNILFNETAWTIVLKTIPITHSCINSYFSFTIIYKFSIIRLFFKLLYIVYISDERYTGSPNENKIKKDLPNLKTWNKGKLQN